MPVRVSAKSKKDGATRKITITATVEDSKPAILNAKISAQFETEELSYIAGSMVPGSGIAHASKGDWVIDWIQEIDGSAKFRFKVSCGSVSYDPWICVTATDEDGVVDKTFVRVRCT